ncbi:hypothetical protein JM18_004110 [Phytophthora kernoviae]|uniref:Partial AB-hydrolase lipase domain-containing protein n=1 Tax=Phytophthora kernoviae TaxID=325452 RepID=A0A921V9T5_9STRA|nr:hypothetical protein JM18_004110 [Phytophthora kernoviae]
MTRRGLTLLLTLSVALLAIASTTLVRAETEVAEANIDPDDSLTVMEIVQRRGYYIEEHKVTTSDNYILTMYRLPKTYVESQLNASAAANKPAVYLIHGLLDSSFTYVCNFRNQSLAFILADAGYDVWLGNNRGTTWSNQHVTYTTDDDEYWAFSWQEMAIYDMPAMINYVLDTSGRSTLSYVGHSEGTMQAFAGFSLDQDLAKKVSYFGALAPVAYLGHITSPIFELMAKTYLDVLFTILGVGAFWETNWLIQGILAKYACAFVDEACDSIINALTGPSDNVNTTRVQVYVSQTPAGTSVKNMAHFAQGIRDNTFRYYDYGCSCLQALGINLCSKLICKNKAVYGAFEPPNFDLSAIKYPRMGLYTGSNDWLATSTDIDQLRASLTDATILTDQSVEYNHLDFTWGYNANELIYQDLLTQVAKFISKSALFGTRPIQALPAMPPHPFQEILLLLLCVTVFLHPALAVQAEVEAAVDPDAGLDTTQIIQARGYVVETHKVTTSDRYVLTMHRLPKSYAESQSGTAAAANKPVVYMQHGLLDSSYTWVLNYRNQSLAFILADLGYDVWLGNNRGNTWSKEHLDYTTANDKFWDFTWEDMGNYDLPAMIKYALRISGRSTLSYIGHSEGTTQAFVGFSNDQELAKSVSYFGALTPVAWTGAATSPILVTMAKTYIDSWFQVFGVNEFSANNAILQGILGKYACAWAGVVCDGFIDLIGGPSDNINASRVHVYVTQTPAGSSVKNMAHYAQGIRDNTFASYDYGCSCLRVLGISLCSTLICENKVKYGSFDPPAFAIGNMVYPRTGFYNGAQDTLATKTDINKLRAGLPDDTIVYDKTIDFGHIDFTWGHNAHANVYDDLISQIQLYEGKSY